jgi:signal transduction histidine kinase
MPPSTGLRRGGVMVALWALLSLMSLVPAALQYVAEGQAVPWDRMWSEFLGWFLWVLLFPAILAAADRFPLERRRWVASLAWHLVIGSAVAVGYAVLVVVKNQLLFSLWTGDPIPRLFQMLPAFILGGFHVYFLVYWMIVAAVHAVDFASRYRERELSASRLEAQLSRAQLQMLKMQLDPHVLFNALNALAALVHRDPHGAERTIGLLSDFLRQSLSSSHRQEVLLEEELRFLDLYVEIEKTRFGERLRVARRVAPEVLTESVPNLILQPLVENAVRHGMRPGSTPLNIEITASPLDDDRLELRVCDDGRGLPDARHGPPREGVGLSNTRARLEQLYGSRQSFELRNGDQGGALARILLPRRRGGEGADAPGTAGLPSVPAGRHFVARALRGFN